jgi:hypothetical protein
MEAAGYSVDSFYPEDGASRFLWYGGIYLPTYTLPCFSLLNTQTILKCLTSNLSRKERA